MERKQALGKMTNSAQKFHQIQLAYEGNELQSKYEIYKKGSPNIYPQDLGSLKGSNIKNSMHVLDMPVIDHMLQEIRNVPSAANSRNFIIHPSKIVKYSNQFKSLVSDQQDLKDFIDWMNEREKNIRNQNCSEEEKFAFKQNLLAAGFHEMLTQIAAVSKPRA